MHPIPTNQDLDDLFKDKKTKEIGLVVDDSRDRIKAVERRVSDKYVHLPTDEELLMGIPPKPIPIEVINRSMDFEYIKSRFLGKKINTPNPSNPKPNKTLEAYVSDVRVDEKNNVQLNVIYQDEKGLIKNKTILSLVALVYNEEVATKKPGPREGSGTFNKTSEANASGPDEVEIDLNVAA